MLDHFRAEMPTALWQRYAGQMTRFLESVIPERRLLAEGKVADPEDYDRIRHHTIGGAALELAEYGIGIDLTEEIEICPEVTEIGAAVIRNWIAINDIFSYRKEMEQNDTMNKIASPGPIRRSPRSRRSRSECSAERGADLL
jgi:terpene synthase-like protein